MEQNGAPLFHDHPPEGQGQKAPEPLSVGREVDVKASCLQNQGQLQGNQVVICPKIESNPLPRFCFQKGLAFCSWKTTSQLGADLHRRPAHTSHCLHGEPVLGPPAVLWFPACELVCRGSVAQLYRIPLWGLSTGYPEGAQGEQMPPKGTAVTPKRHPPTTALFDEGVT